MRTIRQRARVLSGLLLAFAVAPSASATPERDRREVAYFAGGCFWGIEAVFEHVKGVTSAVSGYAGGTTRDPTYEQVGAGDTGHAETVKVVFDPDKVAYATLLRVFLSVAHDPTELDAQGPDVGPQYRSAIFYASPAQRDAAVSAIAELTRTRAFPRPIVTQVVAAGVFYDAEAYHQDYMAHHPDQPYIVANDRPKVEQLRLRFPDLYLER